ncbi:unnamed protein product [Urochloa humidicola]
MLVISSPSPCPRAPSDCGVSQPELESPSILLPLVGGPRVLRQPATAASPPSPFRSSSSAVARDPSGSACRPDLSLPAAAARCLRPPETSPSLSRRRWIPTGQDGCKAGRHGNADAVIFLPNIMQMVISMRAQCSGQKG